MINTLFDWASSQILSLDPEVKSDLSSFAGKLIKVELKGVNVAFYLQPTFTGLQCYLNSEKKPDAVIIGTPIALAMQGLQQKFGWSNNSQGVEIQGDADLVHRLTLLMKKFRIDWEEIIAQAMGDQVAQHVGSAVRKISDYGSDITQRFQSNAADYIQEELRLLPPREEIEDFMSDVDELRDRVERLLATMKES
ncbi:MAG: SCP2 sterol-binding domain-containing protein [Gammaproteobacteria bacterium]|nr:SCP2 sterol-binding domain-containing protein [Gammaproteobacteria bacterium]